jgi:murein DD-endopeptidase MepM/ murein hydrolase activator NlpD
MGAVSTSGWLGIFAGSLVALSAACGGGDSATNASTELRPPSSIGRAAAESSEQAATTVPASVPEDPVRGPPSTTIVAPAVAIPSTAVPRPLVLRVPLGDGVNFSYGRSHHDYPAADIFADCGSPIVAPIDGTLLEVRTVDEWDPSTDNPAKRGGKSIAMLGDDGVRYYMAHFSALEPSLAPGQRVSVGQPLGLVGRTGRAGACHLHLGLSPTCGGKEWKVRRGVIGPWSYLDAWRAGDHRSPGLEIYAWLRDHPGACADALAEATADEA